MSTFNPKIRRSLDGPVRRPTNQPEHRATTPPSFRKPVAPPVEMADAVDATELDQPSLVGADGAQSSLPDEPIFVYRKPKKVRSGWVRNMRWAALAILIVVVSGVGWFGFQGFKAAHNIITRSNGGAPALAGLMDVTKLKGEGDGRVNILVLGIGGDGHDAPNLSDTIMVMSVDPKTKDAAMLSIPRDLYVKIPAGAKNRQQYSKINAANAIGGPELAAKTVANVIGVPIHYYVLVDFSGFRQAVDAVGGVDITVAKDLYDPTYPCDSENGKFCPLTIKAGPQHMTGVVALRYARSRHSTSDFDRAARQQQVIAAVRSKALAASTLTNPVKLTQLINAVGTHVKTDIQPKELSKLATLAKDIDPAKTPQKVLDTDSKDALLNGGINIIPAAGYIEVPKLGNFNYTDIQDLVKNIFSDHYITDENAVVEVQNGSGIAGVAGTVVKSLKAAHYNVGDPVNADQTYTKTVIYDYTGGKKPYTLNYLEKRFNVKSTRATAPSPTPDASGQSASAPQIRIILGSDFSSNTTSP